MALMVSGAHSDRPRVQSRRNAWLPIFPVVLADEGIWDILLRGAGGSRVSVADNRSVIRCEESPWYHRCQSAFEAVAIVAGVVMLLAAAIAHDSASIALLVIGGAWTAMGIAGAAQRRKVFRSAELGNGFLTFTSATEELRVPVTDILEIRRSKGDLNRFSPLRVRTRSHGTIKLSPRLNRLIELLVELRTANPEVRIGGL